MAKILVVEDDLELCEALAATLRSSGHEVVSCGKGVLGLKAVLQEKFDLAIVDWVLPGMSGVELVHHLRQQLADLPILIVTGRDSLQDRVRGLDAGADDYLVKPFAMRELEARARALLRRHMGSPNAPIHLGSLTLISGDPRVLLGDGHVCLPAGEFALLETLASRPGGVVSKAVIGNQLARVRNQLAGGGDPMSDTAIEICVYRLRRRLAPFGVKIRTLRGFGYMLVAPL